MHNYVSIVFVKEVEEYINESFDEKLKMKPIDNQRSARLPLYLKGNYGLYVGTLANHYFLWAIVHKEVNLTAGQLKQQQQELKRFLGLPVIYVFEGLESWQRKRIIEQHIAFVQPFKQVYIPELWLQLNDIHGGKKSDVAINTLSFPAQLAILYHLQITSLENVPFQQIAVRLGYSPMSVSRLVKELQTLALLKIEEGKKKAIAFNYDKRGLWEKSLPYLRSPVREIWHADVYPDNENFFLSGESALSTYSSLNPIPKISFAVSKDNFRKLKDKNLQSDEKFGNYAIEVWQYNPALLSTTKEADKLSVYLSLMDNNDERVQAALKNMINEFKW